MKPKLEMEILIREHIASLGLHPEILELEFTPTKGRDYRLDFAIPGLRIGFEYEGIFAARKGHSGKSRHLTPTGYSNDCEKYSQVSGVLGWRLVRITPIMISDGRAGPLIRAAIDAAVDDRETP